MKGKGNGIRMLAIAGLLVTAITFAMAAPVQAATDLKVTDYNLNTLNSFTYSGAWYNVGTDSYLLKWYGGGEYFEPPWKAPALAPTPYIDKMTATIMADYGGNLWGQCVSMVKNLAHSTVVVDNWQRGRRITDGGVSSGTTIATFAWNSTKGRYVYKPGHAAIFREYTYDSYGKINGIIVWDQNWYKNNKIPREGIVAMHKIAKASADAYYVIQV